MKVSELKQQGVADRACGSFTALLKHIREVDAEETRNERLALEFAWEEYAEELTAQYYAKADAQVIARNLAVCDALEGLEAEGVRDALNARVVNVGGAKWIAL